MDFKLRTKGKEEFWWCNCCDARVRKNTTCEKHAKTKKHLENKMPRDNAAELVHYFCLIRNKIAEMKIAKKAEENQKSEEEEEEDSKEEEEEEESKEEEEEEEEEEEYEESEEEEDPEEEEKYDVEEDVSSGVEDNACEYSDSDSDDE